jgi:hypothetical protein
MQTKQNDPQICIHTCQRLPGMLRPWVRTYEEDFRLQIGVAFALVDHVWRRVRDREVQEPVGRGGHAQGLGSDFQWEQLTSHDPCDRTP